MELQYVTEKMGGAEGTKLDLDFMDMERVSICLNVMLSKVADDYSWNYFCVVAENWRNKWVGRRDTNQNQRVPSAKSNSKSKNGGRQRDFEIVGPSEE